MENLVQKMNDFVGADLDAIVDRIKRGVSPCDMDAAVEIIQGLFRDKIYTTKTKPRIRGVLHGIMTLDTDGGFYDAIRPAKRP